MNAEPRNLIAELILASRRLRRAWREAAFIDLESEEQEQLAARNEQRERVIQYLINEADKGVSEDVEMVEGACDTATKELDWVDQDGEEESYCMVMTSKCEICFEMKDEI